MNPINIPTLDQWKKDTSLGIFKPRSGAMQALDKAIDQYNKSKTNTNLWAIKNALEAWKQTKGSGWRDNPRNGKGTIGNLNAELVGSKINYQTFQAANMSAAELQALAYMHNHKTQVITELFKGKHVKFKAANLPDALKETAGTVKTKCAAASTTIQNKFFSNSSSAPKTTATPVKGFGMSPNAKWNDTNKRFDGGMGSNLGSARTTRDIIKAKLGAMVENFFEIDSITLLGPLGNLILSIVAECATSAAPVIGHIKDGISVVTDWTEVGLQSLP